MTTTHLPQLPVEMPADAELWFVIAPGSGPQPDFYFLAGREEDVKFWMKPGSQHEAKKIWNIYGLAHQRKVEECETRIAELENQLHQTAAALERERHRRREMFDDVGEKEPAEKRFRHNAEASSSEHIGDGGVP